MHHTHIPTGLMVRRLLSLFHLNRPHESSAASQIRPRRTTRWSVLQSSGSSMPLCSNTDRLTSLSFSVGLFNSNQPQTLYGATTTSDPTSNSVPQYAPLPTRPLTIWKTLGSWISHSKTTVKPEWQRSRVLGSKTWWNEVIHGDAMVIPLLIVTFSCA